MPTGSTVSRYLRSTYPGSLRTSSTASQIINEVPKKKAAKFREWILRLAAGAKEGGRVAKKGSLPEPMDAFARSLKEVIGSTYYVGPLREKPRLYQGQAGQAQSLYVGAAGESIAYVLLKGWDDPTTYVSPPTGPNLVFDEADRAVSLGVALNEWVNYLAVAEEVTVEQAGKLGLSLRVREAAAGRTTDLTGVGVGVSQVLPILVQGLAAPPLSTLILEQPELHLHPSLQSRLCDFFVSLVMSSRQVIFETHSDHIVNRMRLHTILGNLRENIDVSLYFLEKPAGSTGSSVRPIRIGSGGSFSDWPEGFCDEHDRVLDRIVEASFAAKKRGGSRDVALYHTIWSRLDSIVEAVPDDGSGVPPKWVCGIRSATAMATDVYARWTPVLAMLSDGRLPTLRMQASRKRSSDFSTT